MAKPLEIEGFVFRGIMPPYSTFCCGKQANTRVIEDIKKRTILNNNRPVWSMPRGRDYTDIVKGKS